MFKKITLAVLFLGMAGCGKMDMERQTAEMSVACDDDGNALCKSQIYVGPTQSIDYGNGGWFPAPHTPNYKAYLNLQHERGVVTANLKTPTCQVIAGDVSLNDFTALDASIRNSAKLISSSMGVSADRGDEYVIVNGKSGDRYNLRAGDTAAPLLKDAALVRANVDRIVAKLTQAHCQKVAVKTTSIKYGNGGWFPAPNTPNYKAYLTLTRAASGGVNGKLDKPGCKASAAVSVTDFNALDAAIKSAEKLAASATTTVDAGDEYVEVNGKSGRYNLRRGDTRAPLIKDPAAIRSHVNRIIKSLSAACISPVK